MYNRVGGLDQEFFEGALAYVEALDFSEGDYDELLDGADEIQFDLLNEGREIEFVLKFNCGNVVVAIQLDGIEDAGEYTYHFVNSYDFV